jgi:cellulose 1,4-beta-cellobiosidase
MFFILLYLFQSVYGFSAGNVKQNVLLPFSITVDGVVKQTFLTLDSNWRWIHNAGGYDNCFEGDSWVTKYCPDSTTCSKNCQIEGVDSADWKAPYGVSVSNNAVTLKYVTQGPYGTNVGSRLYIVSPDKKSYEGFDMRNREISFTVDVSKLPCGLNGAVYFSEMPLTNPYSTSLDASFGVNYGDAQCANDIKYVGGTANLDKRGACSNEYDLWEANSRATSLALHPCSIKGVTPCTTDISCGNGQYRFQGVCDRNGADYNPIRLGNNTFYGVGSSFTIDTTKPIKVITRFPTNSNGVIDRVERYYEQNGKQIFGGVLTDSMVEQHKQIYNEPNTFKELGGFPTMTDSFARKHVLILSLWDDVSVNMRWLDSVYPIGSTEPGAYRGPCASHNNDPSYLRQTYPTSYVVYSDVQIKKLSPSPPTPAPTLPSYCPSAKDFIIAYGGSNVQLIDQGWTITNGGGAATKASFNLLGGSVEYDVDFSGTNPEINANIYSISPKNISKLTGFTQDDYCDGSERKVFCVEIDWIESNGKCAGATAIHTKQGTGVDGCNSWGCTKAISYTSSTFKMRVDYATDGSFTVYRNSQLLFKSSDMKPLPKASEYSILADAYKTYGALIYSSQWKGWVPAQSSCPTGGDLQGSIYKLRNLVIKGTLVQGPEPSKCGSSPTPAPTIPPKPTPAPTTPPKPTPAPTTPPKPTPAPTAPPSGNCAEPLGQCGGASWTGPTCCRQISCVKQNEYYSQCK